MVQLINAFEQGKEKGQLDMKFNNNTFSCRTDSALVAGQAVKLVDALGGVPNVTAVAADTDEVFGYVTYAIRKSSFVIGDIVEISLTGNVMYMVAGAAIAANADIMYVQASGKVITATGVTKIISGRALDKAAADGSIFRVYIKSFADTAKPAA
jgi:uncharacterized membrane protein